MANDGVKIEAKNLLAVKKAMANTIKAMQPSGPALAAVQFATLRLHRYMTGIVHFDTSRLKNSLFPDIDASALIGRIYTNVNYAPYEHDRGGTHAFMTRTQREDAAATAQTTLRMFNTAVMAAWNGTE